MKTSLLKSSLKDYAFLFSIMLAIFMFLLVTKKQWIFFAFLLISSWFIFQKPILLINTLFFLIIFFLSFYLRYPTNLSNLYLNDNFKIIDLNSSGFVIKVQNNAVLVKNYDHYFQIGDIVKVQGLVENIEPKYKNYFLTKKIINVVNHAQINIIKFSQDLRNKFVDYLLDSPIIYQKYSLLIILGIKSNENQEIYQMALKINVVHLFVISGFHISWLFFLIQKFFLIFKLKARVAKMAALVFLFFYLFLIRFPLAGTRALILIMLNQINDYFKLCKLSKISLLAITLGLMSLINPFQISSLGFILTFLATFVIYFVNEYSFKAKWKKYLVMILAVQVIILPITSSVNQFIAFGGLFWGPLLSPLFELVYLLSLFLFPFKNLLTFIYQAFDQILHFFMQISLIIPFPFWTNWGVETFYLLLIISFIINLQWNYFMDQKVI